MKNINNEDLRITSQIKPAELPTIIDVKQDAGRIKSALKDIRNEFSEIQGKMYAYNRYSVLIGLQRMDRAGNDSLIRVVYKEMNPRGVEVESFKTPTSAELEHDFLWRYYKVLPELQKYTDIQNHELDEEVQENIRKYKKI